MAVLAGCRASENPDDRAASNDADVTKLPDLQEFDGTVVPSDRVTSAAYLSTLDERLASDGFPDPNPALIPLLTEARFVATAAADAGNDEYADRVRDRRAPVVTPLENFDRTVRELRTGTEPPDRAAARTEIRERLDRRERTFFDYPGPPHHFVEAAADGGREALDAATRIEELQAATADRWNEYVDQRVTVTAVATGGTEIATSAYEEWSRTDSPSGIEYDDADQYADVVAFNGALAAESMLAANGELVVPP